MLGRPVENAKLKEVQLIAPETLFSTLLTLLPTERIEAMAATAISEAISVYSIAVAPRWSFARRRKMDNITILPKSSGAEAEPAPALYPSIQ